MRALLFLLTLLFAAPAMAQQVTCATRPLGNYTNACASTAFIGQMRTGNSNSLATTSGGFTNGHCVSIDSNSNFIDAGGPCTTGGGGGTVNSGTAGQFGYYASTGASIVGQTSPASAEIWVNPNGSDSNNGLNPIFPKQTLTAGMAALSSGGILHVTGGTFNLAANLIVNPSVLIKCSNTTIITQANSTNLTKMLDFTTNAANNAGAEDCTFDGNSAGQTPGCTGYLAYIGTANNVYLRRNNFKNATCTTIGITDGVNSNIIDNTFSGNGYDVIAMNPSSAQTNNNASIINNKVTAIAAHFMEVNGSDGNIIQGNKVYGSNTTGIVATISGTSVTWVSGGNFAGMRAGNFVVCNGSSGYQELFVTAVNSNTSLTINSAGIAGTSQNCSAGTGDMIDLGGSFNNIIGNHLEGAVTGGVVVNNFVTLESVQQNHIADNIFYYFGNGCIVIDGMLHGGAVMIDNSYIGNHLNNCNVGGNAMYNPATMGAIWINNESSTIATNQFFDGNVIVDSVGAQTKYWMTISGSYITGEASIGKNTSRGVAGNGIYNGFSAVLSANWGTVAFINYAVTNGSSYTISLNSSGTGISANPNIAITKGAYGSEVQPQIVCAVATSTGAFVGGYISSSTISADSFVLAGTPVGGVTYILTCK